jgi:hypothetical protein
MNIRASVRLPCEPVPVTVDQAEEINRRLLELPAIDSVRRVVVQVLSGYVSLWATLIGEMPKGLRWTEQRPELHNDVASVIEGIIADVTRSNEGFAV